MLALQHIPGAHAHSGEGAQDQQGDYHMGVARQRGRVERCGDEVGDDRLRAIGSKLGTGRGLHPRVSDEDPKGAQARANPNKPCRHRVELARHLIAPEQQHAQEDGLQEECEQGFGSKRSTEDVTHETGVVGPVGAEREFHRDARGNADRERRGEDAHPKAHRIAVLLVVAAVVLSCKDSCDQAKADRQRHEDEMICHCQHELDAREQHNIGQCFHSNPL